MRELTVVRAGLLTTVQDRGRFLHRGEGVAVGGALDPVALHAANTMAGNDAGAAALEITLGDAAFCFSGDARFALAGADCCATLDGVPVAPWSSACARAGQTLQLHAAQHGMRSILAVDGGIGVPLVLGSRSTDLAGGFGGHHGRALRNGDRLQLGEPAQRFEENAFRVKPPQWEFDRRIVRVLCGPEFGDFAPSAQAAFWESEWAVTVQSNRMGYRLRGPELEYANTANGMLLSHAVFPGVIQVPPSGQPIVLMNDAQTTGGYPKIGVVCSADLWKLADTRIGGTLRFQPCDAAEAQEARRTLDRYLSDVDAAVTTQARR